MAKYVTKRGITAAVCLGVFILICAALYNGLTVRNYTVRSDKISAPFRIVLLSDLHSKIYGGDQGELIDLIKEQAPDIIMLAGDIADDKTPIDGTLLLLDGIRGIADIYYVSGNHEYWSSSYETIMQSIRSRIGDDAKQPLNEINETIGAIENSGVTILSDEYAKISINGNEVIAAGAEDPARTNYYDKTYDQRISMEKAFSRLSDTGGFKILLAHRPERIEQYKLYDFDLVLSGHAHGGQVRIPLILNGLYAPNQGFFPKYAGGLYEHENLTHIVSRGLVSGGFPPRIFNPPEVVVIDVVPG